MKIHFTSLGKKLPIFALLAVMIFNLVSCKNGEADSRHDSASEEEIDSIIKVNSELMEFVDELTFTIDTITSQEELFLNLVNTESGKGIDKDKAFKQLSFLQNLIQEQKGRISQLELKMKSSDNEHSQKIQKIIASFTQQLNEKEARIEDLEKQLMQKDNDIKTLTNNVMVLKSSIKEKDNQIETQTETIETQTEKLNNQIELNNEAYVIFGTKKELQEMGVLTSSGLFKKSKLNLSNINKEVFNKVDIRHFSEMPISGKKPKILSQMPSESYTLEKTGKDEYLLKILDPKLFWSISNFLIIQY